MDDPISRFRFLKTYDEEKACVINPIPKSTVYKNKWALQIFREWQGQRANKICTIEPGGVFKGEDIGLDVQELTQSTGYASSCRRLHISRVDDTPFGRFTILSAAWNFYYVLVNSKTAQPPPPGNPRAFDSR